MIRLLRHRLVVIGRNPVTAEQVWAWSMVLSIATRDVRDSLQVKGYQTISAETDEEGVRLA